MRPGRVKYHRFLILVGSCVLVAALVYALFPGPYERHFNGPLPPGAQLVHYKRRPAGFDVSYAFVFKAPDDRLLNQLVQEWNLTPAVQDKHDTISFVALRGPPWWLSHQQLNAMPVQYEWVDRQKERYRSVWFDQEKGLLYAEYGKW